MKRRGLVVLALAAACGGGETTPPPNGEPPPIRSIDELADRLGASMCRRLARCRVPDLAWQTQRFYLSDETVCRRALASTVRREVSGLVAAVKAGAVTMDGAVLADCLERDERSCRTEIGVSCRSAFTGTSTACFVDEECARTSRCDRSTSCPGVCRLCGAGECLDPPESACGACKEPIPPEAECADETEVCADGHFCNAPSGGTVGICRQATLVQMAGESCEPSSLLLCDPTRGLECQSRRCAAVGHQDSSCEPGLDFCHEGLTCHPDAKECLPDALPNPRAC